MRRIRHAAASIGGKIYIIGGEKDDGSGLAFSDCYVFDPTVPSFTLLPSANGPPDLYGHSVLVLSGGRIIVFGGYSPSLAQLTPFSTVWLLDTTKSPLAWTTLPVSTATLPPWRLDFASVVLTGDEVLIHGGADSTLETSFSDGWILDTTVNPAGWTNVTALSALGPLRDHFAFPIGVQVLIGFGA